MPAGSNPGSLHHHPPHADHRTRSPEVDRKPRNPLYAERVAAIFDTAPFMKHLGVRLLRCEPGLCETVLVVQPGQLQQDGYVHAGVQATFADHTAGAAAGTLMAADEIVLTVELKINLLRAAQGAPAGSFPCAHGSRGALAKLAAHRREGSWSRTGSGGDPPASSGICPARDLALSVPLRVE